MAVCFACIRLTEHNLDARKPCIGLGHSTGGSEARIEHSCQGVVRQLAECLDCGTLVEPSAFPKVTESEIRALWGDR